MVKNALRRVPDNRGGFENFRSIATLDPLWMQRKRIVLTGFSLYERIETQ